MSASVSTTSSPGRGRAVLLVVLVAILAVVAAVATVVISDRTYAPTERIPSVKTQVAAGTEYIDEAAGLALRVPEGWRAESENVMFGSTMLIPDTEDQSEVGGFVFIGTLTPEMLGGMQIPDQDAAIMLANEIGQTVLMPVPSTSADEKVEDITTRMGEGTAVSFRVIPELGALPEGMTGPDEALIYSAVVHDDEKQYWLTYVGSPADGTINSPEADWAKAVFTHFRPA